MSRAPRVVSCARAHAPVVSLAVAAAIAFVAFHDGEPDAWSRHVLLVPVVAVAMRGGFAAGLVAGLSAALLAAPFVLPHLETDGMTRAVTEGLVTLAALVLAGGLVGVLAAAVSRERTHHRLLHALQDALAADEPLQTALDRLGGVLSARLDVDVGILLDEGAARVTTGDAELLLNATSIAVLETGVAAFVPDTGGGPRPRRLAAVPIGVRDRRVGVLVAARVGDLGAGERARLHALGAWIGLALENARLAARQRRFAAELADRIESVRRERDTLDRAKSRFVATASHELRTPLTALRGFSELLARRRYATEDVQRFAGVMLRETERLARLIDDLLDLSRLEHGLEPPIRRTSLDLAASLDAATALFNAEGATHRIVLECEPALPRVQADADAVDRIVKNLVANAVKYAPPGAVHVRARAMPGERSVEVAVEDEGIGIPPDALPHVFEPYFRAESTARAVRGTGIGLAVVKALVEAQGGRVGVESAPGAGTRFRFTLPVDAPAPAP